MHPRTETGGQTRAAHGGQQIPYHGLCSARGEPLGRWTKVPGGRGGDEATPRSENRAARRNLFPTGVGQAASLTFGVAADAEVAGAGSV